MSEWKPIESAPKDGTLIMGWEAKHPDISRFVRWGQIGFSPSVMAWVTPSKCAVSYPPTHWMELPEPPGTSS